MNMEAIINFLKSSGISFYEGRDYLNIFEYYFDSKEFNRLLKEYNLTAHAGFNCIVIE